MDRYVLAAFVFVAVATAAQASRAEVGVTSVVVSGAPDERLRRAVEQAVVAEVLVLGHQVATPDELTGRFHFGRGSFDPRPQEWAQAARDLGLSAVVITRLANRGAGVTLFAQVVLADGTSPRSGERDVGHNDVAKSARALVAYLLGPCVDMPTCTNQLRGSELALGRDLDRAFLRYKQRRGGSVRSFLEWRLELEEARLDQGQNLAGIGAPLVAVGAAAAAFGLFYRAEHGGGHDAADEYDEDGEASGSWDNFGLYFSGSLVVMAGIGATVAMLITGAVKAGRSLRNIPRLERALDAEPEDDSTRLRFGWAPLVGPDGRLGAGAVIYF